MTARRQLLLAGLFLALLPLVVLWPAVFGSKAFVPFDSRTFPPESLAFSTEELAARKAHSNFDITEKTLLCLHEIRFAQEELRQGRLPVWNPGVRGGAPLFANALNGFANPLFAPHLLVDPEHAFACTGWLAMALAGLFMLGFLREVGLALPAALLGAVLFAWSGTMVANAHFFMRHGALLFLPGAFWALERLRKGSGPGAAAGLAVCVALTWTAGFPPYALAGLLLTGGYLLVLVVSGPDRGHRLLWGGTGLVLGIALASVQLLPMFGYFPESQRDLNPDLLRLPEQGLDPMGWLGFLLPGAFSRPDVATAVPYEFSPLCWLLFSRAGEGQAQPLFNATEYAVYLGVLPLLLLARPGVRGRGPFPAFALAAALVFVLISSGGMVARWLYLALPPLRSTPPMRFIGPVAFLIAGATARAFDHWLAGTPTGGRRRAPWLAGLLVLALAGGALLALQLSSATSRMAGLLSALEWRWGERFQAIGKAQIEITFARFLDAAVELLRSNLAHVCVATAALLLVLWRLPRRVAAWAVPLLAAAELLWLAPPYVPCHPAAGVPRTPVHEFLRAQRAAHAEAGGFTVARVSVPGSVPEAPIALPANSLIPDRIRDLNSYAFVDGRSHLPFKSLYGPECFIREYWMKAFADDARLELPLFDLFGVKYLLCLAPPGSPPVQHAGQQAMPPLTGSEGTFQVFERPHPCPRAFVVPEVLPFDSDREILTRMVAADFAPRQQALVRRDELEQAGGTGWSSQRPEGDPGQVRFLRDEPTMLELSVTGARGGVLLVADTFMTGWQAEVNGRTVPVVRADLCFRALPIPSGDSRVVLRYSAPLLVPGAAVSALALLACAVLLVLAFLPKPRAHHSAGLW